VNVMDHRLERVIHHPVALNQGFAFKISRNDDDAEMPAAGFDRSGMPGVKIAVIEHFQRMNAKGFLENAFDLIFHG